jgi:hypothetical protein
MSTETERRIENILSNKMKIEGNDGASPSSSSRIKPSVNASAIETASGFDNKEFSSQLQDLQNSRKVYLHNFLIFIFQMLYMIF